MENKQFNEDFVGKFNSALQEYLKKEVNEKGAICLPFIHCENIEDGWSNIDHTHFDVNVDGKMYHGKLFQFREFIGEYSGERTDTETYINPDEDWTETGLENEKERNYEADIWIDSDNREGTYVNIELTEDTIDLLNNLYVSRKIFTGENPREFYNSETLSNMGYSVSEIANGIETREGEIEKVINETNELARLNNREETIEQDGQTQADK